MTECVKIIKLTSCSYVEEKPERSGSMEIAMLDGRLPRVTNILFFQPEVVDGWMEVVELGKKMVSWNNYCPPPRNIIAQNYRLFGDYFSWDPGGRSYKCSSDHWPITLFFFQFIDYRLVTYAH